MQSRTALYINIKTIVNNYKIFEKALYKNQKITAVVKANAYGHGDLPVSLALQNAGCNSFAVATLLEGVKLRKGGIVGEIIILGYTPISDLTMVKRYNLIQTIVSKTYLDHVIKTGVKISAVFKINTGMNRLGLLPDKKTAYLIKNASNKLNVLGIFTHLACADNPLYETLTKRQINSFQALENRLIALNLPIISCFNSAGIINYNKGYSTRLRLGISLYGYKPSGETILPQNVKSAIKWKATVTSVFYVKKGDGVGYGHTFIATKKTLVATLSVGYADGYSRALSNKGKVLVNGVTCRVIGRVCMDQIMIDVTNVSGVKEGTKAWLLWKEYTAEDMAKDLNTIPYEITCKISGRVDRIYK